MNRDDQGLNKPFSARIHDAVFFSDNHLFAMDNGACHKQAGIIAHNAKKYYAVGDFADKDSLFRTLKKEFGLDPEDAYFGFPDFTDVLELLAKNHPQVALHNKVPQLLFQKLCDGAEVYMTPGNHDEIYDLWDGRDILGIQVAKELIYTSPTGEQYSVAHGHRNDIWWNNKNGCGHPPQTRMGNIRKRLVEKMLNNCGGAVDGALWLDGRAQKLGLTKKFHATNGIKFIGKVGILLTDYFPRQAIKDAREKNLQGAIRGHIHLEDIRWIDGLLYLNPGDGLTHGSGILHKADLSDNPAEQFRLWKADKHLNPAWALASAEISPKAKARATEFMQKSWEAMLEHELEFGRTPGYNYPPAGGGQWSPGKAVA